MPNGRGKSKPGGNRLRIDAAEVREEIRRNRESNERFMREYSEWFEKRSRGAKKRPAK